MYLRRLHSKNPPRPLRHRRVHRGKSCVRPVDRRAFRFVGFKQAGSFDSGWKLDSKRSLFNRSGCREGAEYAEHSNVKLYF